MTIYQEFFSVTILIDTYNKWCLEIFLVWFLLHEKAREENLSILRSTWYIRKNEKTEGSLRDWKLAVKRLGKSWYYALCMGLCPEAVWHAIAPTWNTNVNLRSFQVRKFISGWMPSFDFTFRLITIHLHFHLNLLSSCPLDFKHHWRYYLVDNISTRKYNTSAIDVIE